MLKIYILLHGAWHANWSWQRVAQKLEASYKCNILTPNLPGHGDNHDDFKEINLNSYVSYVVDLVNSMPDKVTLVGHSMSGIVISQVAENIPEKISKLVYVSAFVPDYNGSLVDEEQKALMPSVSREVIFNEMECLINIKHPLKVSKLFYNLCQEEDINYALKNLQNQPMRPFFDKVQLSNSNFGNIPKVYIECLEDNAINIVDQRRMHAKIDCEVISIKADHSPFFSATEELVEIIASI